MEHRIVNDFDTQQLQLANKTEGWNPHYVESRKVVLAGVSDKSLLRLEKHWNVRCLVHSIINPTIVDHLEERAWQMLVGDFFSIGFLL